MFDFGTIRLELQGRACRSFTFAGCSRSSTLGNSKSDRRNDLLEQFDPEHFDAEPRRALILRVRENPKSLLVSEGGKGGVPGGGGGKHMFKTLEQAVFEIREHKLNIPEKWFTGKQWSDGSAQKQIREDYRRAIKEYDPTIEIVDDDIQLEF